MAKKQPKKGKMKKPRSDWRVARERLLHPAEVSKSETVPPDAANHVGEIWHKPFSYTYKGRKVEVPGHWERKPGSGPRPKEAKPAKPKAAKKERPKKQGKSYWAKKVAAGGELEQDPNLFHQDAEGRLIPLPPQGAMTFASATRSVGKDHHEAEQAAAAGLEKLKAAQQKPVAVPPATATTE